MCTRLPELTGRARPPPSHTDVHAPMRSRKARQRSGGHTELGLRTCASVMLKCLRQGSRNAAFWSPNTSWLT